MPSADTDKDELAHRIAAKDKITTGLVAILTCVAPCMSFEIHRNKEEKRLDLVPRVRKCLFLYQYWIHPHFGWMNARIQSWLPFSIQICLHGREWLARMMDHHQIRYRQNDNCFTWIEDVDPAQRLMNRQLRISWPQALARIARPLNPAHGRMFRGFPARYYWSMDPSDSNCGSDFVGFLMLRKEHHRRDARLFSIAIQFPKLDVAGSIPVSSSLISISYLSLFSVRVLQMYSIKKSNGSE